MFTRSHDPVSPYVFSKSGVSLYGSPGSRFGPQSSDVQSKGEGLGREHKELSTHTSVTSLQLTSSIVNWSHTARGRPNGWDVEWIFPVNTLD